MQTILLVSANGDDLGAARLLPLYALPIPRGVLYAAKQIGGMVLIGLSTAVLIGLLAVSGLGMRLLIPGLGLEAPVPWLEFARYGLTMFLGSWLVIAIQTWVRQSRRPGCGGRWRVGRDPAACVLDYWITDLGVATSRVTWMRSRSSISPTWGAMSFFQVSLS